MTNERVLRSFDTYALSRTMTHYTVVIVRISSLFFLLNFVESRENCPDLGLFDVNCEVEVETGESGANVDLFLNGTLHNGIVPDFNFEFKFGDVFIGNYNGFAPNSVQIRL